MEKEIKFISPGICPLCGSEDVTFEDVTARWDGTCFQPCTCNECNAKWTELYKFVDKQLIED